MPVSYSPSKRGDVALAKQLEPVLGDEAFLDNEETVALERLDLLGGECLDHGRSSGTSTTQKRLPSGSARIT